METATGPTVNTPWIVPERKKTGIRFSFDAIGFPVSATFAVFLDATTQGGVFPEDERDWWDQVTEKMNPGLKKSRMDFMERAQRASDKAFATPVGKNLTLRTYQVLASLMAGNLPFLSELQGKNRFIFVVSAPRHGGSYLIKELLLSTGHHHEDFPSYFIHDGYPDISSQWISNVGMETVPMTRRAMQQTAEWMVMADWFFKDAKPFAGLRNIPKKATKFIYEARFIRDTFGPHAEYIVPVRHPAAACLSLVEKAGGIPDGGRFPRYARSAIENWIMDSWADDGVGPDEVAKMPYFTAYLGYWNRYFQILATNGMLRNNRNLTVLPYTKNAFEDYLQKQHDRFRSGRIVGAMHIQPKVAFLHPEWLLQSQTPLEDMGNLWQSFGVHFPMGEIVVAN
jgi:hypothetical protein